MQVQKQRIYISFEMLTVTAIFYDVMWCFIALYKFIPCKISTLIFFYKHTSETTLR